MARRPWATPPTRLASPTMLAALALGVAVLAGCGSRAASADPALLPPPNERFRSAASLESYRWSMEIEATAELLDTGEAPPGLELDDAILYLHIQGARINPDREWTLASTSFGYLQMERETVVVDNRLWSRQENGAWRERATLSSPEDFIGQDVGISPAVILGTDDPEHLQRITDDLFARPYDVQRLNGYETWHWVLDTGWADGLFEGEDNPLPAIIEPETMHIEVWTDMATGVAVRVVLVAGSASNAEAFKFQMDLFDLNDPSIEIEVPHGAIGSP